MFVYLFAGVELDVEGIAVEIHSGNRGRVDLYESHGSQFREIAGSPRGLESVRFFVRFRRAIFRPA
jgi:hypothetical protein